MTRGTEESAQLLHRGSGTHAVADVCLGRDQGRSNTVRLDGGFRNPRCRLSGRSRF